MKTTPKQLREINDKLFNFYLKNILKTLNWTIHYFSLDSLCYLNIME